MEVEEPTEAEKEFAFVLDILNLEPVTPNNMNLRLTVHNILATLWSNRYRTPHLHSRVGSRPLHPPMTGPPPNRLAIDFLPADGHHVIDVIQRKGIKNVLANPPKTHVWEVTALEKGGDPGHEGQYYTKRSKASQC